MTGALLRQVLPWVAPPLVGAVAGALVGYAVGRVGLRMLLSPRRRSGIARAIGSVAARELGPLVARLRQPGAEAGPLRVVSLISEQILSRPLSSIVGTPSSSAGSLAGGMEVLLQRVFRSPAFMNGVRGIVAGIVSSVLGRRPADILGRVDVKAIVAERIIPLLSDPDRRATLARNLASVAANRAGGILTDDVLAGLEGALEPALPSAGERAALWLQSPETRQLLSERARELLPRILEKLNAVQRLLLSAGQYDRRLAEKMPEIVDDTVRSLLEVARDRSQQRRVLAAGMDALRDWRNALKKDGEAGHGADARVGLMRGLEPLIERGLKALEDPGSRDRVSGSLEAWLSSGHQTLGGLLRSTFGVQETQVVEFLSERVLTWLTGDRAAGQAAGALSGFVTRYLADNGTTTIRDLMGMDAARKERLDGLLVARLVGAEDRLLPEILKAIDVENLVASQVAGMDAHVAERLVAQAVRPRMKWITVPGALVGVVVGLFELILKILGAG